MSFSIIIPVYNVAPYLHACIDSIVVAVHKIVEKVEIICIDDGSVDGSAEILEEYASKWYLNENFRFIVERGENAGVSAARNRGLEVATGDWILFVDADDFVRETWLEDVVDMIVRNHDADLIGFEKLPYYGNDEWGEAVKAEQDVGIAEKISDVLVGFCVYQFAYASRLISQVRFLSLSVGEDLVFVAEALSRSRRCVISERCEYGYRYRQESASHSEITPQKMVEIVAFNQAMFGILSKSGKRIGDAFIRGRGNEWFVTLPRIIFAHRHDVEWRCAYNQWLDSMRNFADLSCMPRQWRIRARRVARQRSWFCVWWNVLLPTWIKRKVFGL